MREGLAAWFWQLRVKLGVLGLGPISDITLRGLVKRARGWVARGLRLVMRWRGWVAANMLSE